MWIVLLLARSRTGKARIQSVGICAGSGASFLEGAQADLWWTGEMSHHEILATVAGGTHVVLCKLWLVSITLPELKRNLTHTRRHAHCYREAVLKVILPPKTRRYAE